jgi:hypothetical protein
MNTRAVNQTAGNTSQTRRKRLERLLTRSPALGATALFCVHAAGCLLMFVPPLTTIAAGAAAIFLAGRIQGPLDGFLTAALVTVSLFSAYLSVQLFRLRPHQPRGIAVGKQQAPELFAMLARRAAHFKTGSVNDILLTSQAELQVIGSPVLPLPLFHRYSLCVGAPLMMFLGAHQFRLALAGAVAASADNRSRLTGWLNQATSDWPLILATLETSGNLLSRVLAPPLRGIARAAAILAHPLHEDWRQQQARWLMENSNEQSAIEYLATQVVTSAFMDRQYWPMILKGAERCPTPVVKAFSHLPLLLKKTLNYPLAERWLMQAQTARGWRAYRIPDLLAELKIERLHWTGLPDPDAFSALFISGNVLKQLDGLWQQEIELEWRKRHARYQSDQSRFRQLQRRAADQALRGASALHYIQLVPRFLGEADTIPAYRAVYATNADDPKVCFAAGLALLRAGAGQDGSQALQRAADIDPALTRRVRVLIREHRQALVRKEVFNEHAVIHGVCA